MLLFPDYIVLFRNEAAAGDKSREELADQMDACKKAYDISIGGNALGKGFAAFVATYNWLGQPTNKTKYKITQNLARNLPGALMQDWLISLVNVLVKPYPDLEIFSEVPVPFGMYPLWEKGTVGIRSPSERSDIAV